MITRFRLSVGLIWAEICPTSLRHMAGSLQQGNLQARRTVELEHAPVQDHGDNVFGRECAIGASEEVQVLVVQVPHEIVNYPSKQVKFNTSRFFQSQCLLESIQSILD